MRVTQTTTNGPAQTRKKQAQSSANGFKVQTEASTASQAADRPAAAQAVAGLDSLLALQEAPDAGQGSKKAIRRAGDMLDLLEEIRLDLLNGVLPAKRLANLLELVKTQRGAVHDPRLAHVLDEIELRAKVELAKADRYK